MKGGKSNDHYREVSTGVRGLVPPWIDWHEWLCVWSIIAAMHFNICISGKRQKFQYGTLVVSVSTEFTSLSLAQLLGKSAAGQRWQVFG